MNIANELIAQTRDEELEGVQEIALNAEAFQKTEADVESMVSEFAIDESMGERRKHTLETLAMFEIAHDYLENSELDFDVEEYLEELRDLEQGFGLGALSDHMSLVGNNLEYDEEIADFVGELDVISIAQADPEQTSLNSGAPEKLREEYIDSTATYLNPKKYVQLMEENESLETPAYMRYIAVCKKAAGVFDEVKDKAEAGGANEEQIASLDGIREQFAVRAEVEESLLREAQSQINERLPKKQRGAISKDSTPEEFWRSDAALLNN